MVQNSEYNEDGTVGSGGIPDWIHFKFTAEVEIAEHERQWATALLTLFFVLFCCVFYTKVYYIVQQQAPG